MTKKIIEYCLIEHIVTNRILELFMHHSTMFHAYPTPSGCTLREHLVRTLKYCVNIEVGLFNNQTVTDMLVNRLVCLWIDLLLYTRKLGYFLNYSRNWQPLGFGFWKVIHVKFNILDKFIIKEHHHDWILLLPL